MSADLTMAEAIGGVIEHATNKLFCSRPARVLAYDATTQKVDVEVALSETVETDEETVVHPVASLFGVPVAFPRGGGFFVSLPIAVGDYVLLVFADRSIDLWLKNGGANVDPVDLRRHAIGDAVAIPGCYPDPNALMEADANKMIMGMDGGMRVSIDNTGSMMLAAAGAATQAVALADKVDAEMIAVKSDLDALKVKLAAHIHVPNGVPVAPTDFSLWVPHTPAAVGSTKVSAEE